MTDQTGSGEPDRLRQAPSVAAFASHIDQYHLAEHEALNRELACEIAAWRDEEGGITASNQLGWHSPRTLFERDAAAFRRLRGIVESALTVSVSRYWPEFDPARDEIALEAWANVNGKGAFNAPHDHVGFHLSGCYYVAVPPPDGRSGWIEILNPVAALAVKLPTGRLMTPDKITVEPKEGGLLIFPSHLRHWVYPNQQDAERISIAFNVRLLGASNT